MVNGKMAFISSYFYLIAVNCGFAAGTEPLLSKSTNTSISVGQVQNGEVADFGRIKIRGNISSGPERKRIEFYDSLGNLSKEISMGVWDMPRIASERKLIGVQKFDFKSQTMQVFDENGELLREIKNIAPYRNIYMADDGSFVVAGIQNTPHLSLNGNLIFYSNTGRILSQTPYKVMKTSAGGYLNGSNYFMFLVRAGDRGTFLDCYDRIGTKIWTHVFPDVAAFDALDSLILQGDLAVVKLSSGGQKHTWLFSKRGLVAEKEGW